MPAPTLSSFLALTPRLTQAFSSTFTTIPGSQQTAAVHTKSRALRCLAVQALEVLEVAMAPLLFPAPLLCRAPLHPAAAARLWPCTGNAAGKDGLAVRPAPRELAKSRISTIASACLESWI